MISSFSFSSLSALLSSSLLALSFQKAI